ncbi:MAG: thioesterase family protein [Pseudomonadota bacterium]
MRQAAGQRSDYRWFLPLTTRWADNDIYGHINNVNHYAYFDTVANQYLIDAGGFDPLTSPAIGYVVESGCRYHASIRHPEPLHGGLRVSHLGTSSVRYEMAIFGAGESAAAEGFFTHVFVDRSTERPTPIPATIRAALTRILTNP